MHITLAYSSSSLIYISSFHHRTARPLPEQRACTAHQAWNGATKHIQANKHKNLFSMFHNGLLLIQSRIQIDLLYILYVYIIYYSQQSFDTQKFNRVVLDIIKLFPARAHFHLVFFSFVFRLFICFEIFVRIQANAHRVIYCFSFLHKCEEVWNQSLWRKQKLLAK